MNILYYLLGFIAGLIFLSIVYLFGNFMFLIMIIIFLLNYKEPYLLGKYLVNQFKSKSV